MRTINKEQVCSEVLLSALGKVADNSIYILGGWHQNISRLELLWLAVRCDRLDHWYSGIQWRIEFRAHTQRSLIASRTGNVLFQDIELLKHRREQRLRVLIDD